MFDFCLDSPGSTPVLDLNRVCDYLDMSVEEVMLFIPGAMEEIGLRLGLIGTAMLSGNLSDIALHSHTLKSVTASIGAPAVHVAFVALEQAARNNDPAECMQYIRVLKRETERLTSEISRL
ncbi:Hpt domain-containing protein [Pseudodesulfovibrio sediminis]|uniref:HPt domain-containing protein n=1 Tax=Pseudodesulfovibrio sediminis TaxID=2810563 RepID=A0ABN6EVJ0_9BACT|nr:Hpt domain-containing protein [Pseudodesulfovibrio sediminis]BCS89269.1 hypothetical protein PSDVSF_25110 [Pseudodesulfovibrio sediminis]